MKLNDLLKRIKKSYFVKIIVNNKFYLFNCYREKMNDHIHSTYIDGFEDIKVDYYITNDEHGGHKTVKIYINDDTLEEHCLYIENLWYDDRLKRKEEYLCW